MAVIMGGWRMIPALRPRQRWALGLTATVALGLPDARAADWPQFHGPRRDNLSTETGLLKQWPEGGPKLLWTAKGIGHGFSAVAVADGLIYATGNTGPDTLITALDLDGKVKWTAKNGPAYKREHPGTRSTPTIDGARLYHENADGDVVCLDAKTGKPLWSLNILQRFRGRNITWGLAESLLVDGNNLICTPGGEEIGIVALHKLTGETVWSAKGIGEKPGYASTILVEHKGLRQIVALMAKALVGVNADTGELLWRFGHETPYDESLFTPLFHDGHIYFATAHARGSRLLKLNVEGRKSSVELAWSTEKLDSHHGGVILLDGCLYGFCHGNYKPRWDCLELKTGKLMHSLSTPTAGCVTYADGLIYGMDERGTVILIKPTPAERVVVSQFAIPKGGPGPVWAHPVVCGGRLYLRHSDSLFAYDIQAK
jgi:outer membrane protein assembly factor BamB